MDHQEGHPIAFETDVCREGGVFADLGWIVQVESAGDVGIARRVRMRQLFLPGRPAKCTTRLEDLLNTSIVASHLFQNSTLTCGITDERTPPCYKSHIK